MASLSKLLIAILLFSALFIGIFHIYGDLISHYPESYSGNDAQTDYGAVYQQINETFELTVLMTDKVRNSSSIEETAEDSSRLGVFSALRLVWDSYNLANKLMQAVASELLLPTWVVKTVMTIILITILFAIASAIFRHDL